MIPYRPSPAPSFLRRRSATIRGVRGHAPLREGLLIAPETKAAAVAEAMLRLLSGYVMHVSIARTLGSGLDQLLAGAPDILVLSDHLPPQDDAVGVLPILRRCGYKGPIVVIGLVGGRERSRALRQAGAADALAEHEMEGARFAEALLSAQLAAAAAG